MMVVLEGAMVLKCLNLCVFLVLCVGMVLKWANLYQYWYGRCVVCCTYTCNLGFSFTYDLGIWASPAMVSSNYDVWAAWLRNRTSCLSTRSGRGWALCFWRRWPMDIPDDLVVVNEVLMDLICHPIKPLDFG